MEPHQSTTPFGRRSLTLVHVASQAAAKARSPEKFAHKWNVFRAICAARSHLGVSERALAVLDALLTFHPETILAGDDLVVFPSNRQLSLRAHGMAPATLRRHLAVLVDAGLIVRRDSPNGKRYARKDGAGEVEIAFGFDLSPLVARAEEFETLAERVRAEERALKRLRERITICRRDIAKMIVTGMEEGVPTRLAGQGPADWTAIHERFRAIVVRIPRTATREDLEPVAEELALLSAEVLNLLETHVNSQKINANESQTERHIQNSNPKTNKELEPSLQKGWGADFGSAVRQRAERDREIASLFRKGDAETALEMKRDDGTAILVDGDYEQVVKAVADLYMQRSDALKMRDPSMSVTITTLTNAEAADISLAIRERLKARGEIGSDETTYKAVVYRGDKPEMFDLPIATGDRLRLFRQTRIKSGQGFISIGNNGDVVDVLGKTANGLVLRNARGVTANVEWRTLSDKTTGRLLLGPGRAFTIDAAQGMSTKGEHINALPRGTVGTTAFKMYTAESRATGRTHTVISKGAVLAAVQRSRALGDRTPIHEDDLWRRVEKNASEKPYKALAIDLLEKGRKQRDQAIVDGLKQHKILDDAERAEAGRAKPMLGAHARKAFEEGLAREAISEKRGALKALVNEAVERLREAGEFLAEHVRSPPDVMRPSEPTKPRTPQAPAQDDEPAARPPSPSMR